MSLLTDLVYSYELAEASGNFLDARNSYTLTANGSPGSTSGIGGVGNSRSFNGSNQWGEAADANHFDCADADVTFETWVYFSGISTFRGIFGKGTAADASNLEYCLQLVSANQFRFDVRDVANSTTTQRFSSTFGQVANSVWYQVICWHDAANNILGIRVNNGAKDTTSYSGGIRTGVNPFALGRRQDGVYHNGRLQYHRRWNRILSDAEATQLYNGGAGLPYSAFAGGTDVNVSASTLVSVVSSPTPVVSANAGTTTNPLTILSSIQLPVVSAGGLVTPTVLNLLTSLPVATTSGTASTAAGVLGLASSLPNPTATVDFDTTPQNLQLVINLPIPSIESGGNITVDADPLEIDSFLIAPGLSANADTSVNTLSVVSNINDALAYGEANTTANILQAFASLPGPSVVTDDSVNVSVSTLEMDLTLNVPDIEVSGDVVFYAEPLSLTAVLPNVVVFPPGSKGGAVWATVSVIPCVFAEYSLEISVSGDVRFDA